MQANRTRELARGSYYRKLLKQLSFGGSVVHRAEAAVLMKKLVNAQFPVATPGKAKAT